MAPSTPRQEAECAYTLFVIATFWLTEALPLSVTALLPGLMFPLFGIMPSKNCGICLFQRFSSTANWSHLLSNINRKMEFTQKDRSENGDDSGCEPSMVLTLGFMSSTAFLSMWLSNTSTAAMVMPIVEAVAQQIISAEAEVEATQMTYFSGSTNHGLEIDESVNEHETNERKEKTIPVPGYSNDAGKNSSNMELEKNSGTGAKYRTKKDHMMCKLMCLCIAYSSTIGGLTTITGTSTNLIFAEHFNMRYPECRFNFKEMFKCGKTKTVKQKACAEVIKQEYQKLGPIRYQEIVTLVLFIVMALLWFSRDPGFVPGWSALFSKYPGFATDSTVALLIGLLFFLIPAKRLTKTTPTGEIVVPPQPGRNHSKFRSSYLPKNNRGILKTSYEMAVSVAFDYSPLITWKEFQSFMPWDIAILVGGGFALADGCENICPDWTLDTQSDFKSIGQTLELQNPRKLKGSQQSSYHYPSSPDIIFTGVKAGLGVNIVGVAVVMLGMSTWIVTLFDLSTYPSWAPPISNATMP
ncbi:solute carrier family 13 member 1 isoform X1 [Prionailurus iriomotensis]